VNQHPFFINLLKIAETETETLVHIDWKQQKLAALARLYDETLQAVITEWEIIFDVFPNSGTVIQVFVQRIFAQSVTSSD
jgi:hypothetical protein